MAQAVWTGAIGFGLVHIPVRLYPATDPKDVRFHLYDSRTGRRLRNLRVTRDDEFPEFAPLRPLPSTLPAPAEPPPRGRNEEPAPHEAVPPERIEPPSVPPDFAVARVVSPGEVVRGLELPSGDLVTVSDEELASLAPARSRTIEIEEFVRLAEIDPVFYEKSYHVAPVRGSGAEKPYVLLQRAMLAAGMVGIGRFVLRTKAHLVAIRPLSDSLALE